MSAPSLETIGIIAGNRTLPIEFATHARALGVKRLVAVAFEGETDPGLAELVDDIVWLRVGQLTRMIRAFISRDVRHCVMVGQIAPRNLFDLRPDLRAAALLMRLKEKNAHSIFGAIAGELQKEGVELIEATPWLKPIMPGPDFTLGPALSPSQRDDARFGFHIAKEISRLEIGQSVVVKDGAVLAVEGFEGTDRCLQRGGDLAGKTGSALAVKVARENHDLRFDIPCIGPQTFRVCAASRISALIVEAERTLLLERPLCEQLVRQHKISFAALAASRLKPIS